MADSGSYSGWIVLDAERARLSKTGKCLGDESPKGKRYVAVKRNPTDRNNTAQATAVMVTARLGRV